MTSTHFRGTVLFIVFGTCLTFAHAQPPPPVVAATPARLGLPKPVKPYPMEPGLRIETKAGQMPVVGVHMIRKSDGQFRMYLKFASSKQRWITYATSKNGARFTPSNLWLKNAPFLVGPRMSANLINVTNGSMVAAYAVPTATGSRIDIAISKDDSTWRVIKAPALAGSGQAGDGGPTDPTVLIAPGGLVMYYVRRLNGLDHIFMAKSQDGYNWTATPASCLTNAPSLGLKSLTNPTVAMIAPNAWFMVFATTDAAGKKSLGMAVSADGVTFQYLGSLGQIIDLSAYKSVTCPQINLTAAGTLRILMTVTKSDGGSGIASATVPAKAVTCIPATAAS